MYYNQQSINLSMYSNCLLFISISYVQENFKSDKRIQS